MPKVNETINSTTSMFLNRKTCFSPDPKEIIEYIETIKTKRPCKKIDETKRAGATNKHGVEAKKFIVNKSLGIGSFLKRYFNNK